MSLSRPETGTTNPVSIFYSYNGEKGEFEKRTKGEGKTSIGKTLKFIVIEDAVMTIGGGTDASNYYYSNYVKRQSDVLNVRHVVNGRSATIESGTYKEISAKLPKDAKYTRVLYIWDVENEKYASLQIKGSAVSAFFKYLEENKLHTLAGRVTIVRKSVTKQKGTTTYEEPVFESREHTEDEKGLIEQLTQWDDKVLQPYLDGKPQEETKEELEETKEEVPVKLDDMPDLGDIDDNPF